MAGSSRMKLMGMNHDMKTSSLLLNDSFTLLNTELNDKRVTKFMHFNSASPSGSDVGNYATLYVLLRD
jgi:hypothetical protein